MATRYSGDLKIQVTYDDRDHYRTSISHSGRLLWRGIIRPPASGYGRGVSYDSDQAYDSVARAALSHADYEMSMQGSGVIAAHAEPGFKVRRVPRYFEQWPGGRVRPKRFSSRDRARSSSRSSRRR